MEVCEHGSLKRKCNICDLEKEIAQTADELKRVLRERDEAYAKLDRFLNEHCQNGEYCELCADICCPHKDTLHFHHDGCPSCSADG